MIKFLLFLSLALVARSDDCTVTPRGDGYCVPNAETTVTQNITPTPVLPNGVPLTEYSKPAYLQEVEELLVDDMQNIINGELPVARFTTGNHTIDLLVKITKKVEGLEGNQKLDLSKVMREAKENQGLQLAQGGIENSLEKFLLSVIEWLAPVDSRLGGSVGSLPGDNPMTPSISDEGHIARIARLFLKRLDIGISQNPNYDLPSYYTFPTSLAGLVKPNYFYVYNPTKFLPHLVSILPAVVENTLDTLVLNHVPIDPANYDVSSYYAALLIRKPKDWDVPKNWFLDSFFVEQRMIGPNAIMTAVVKDQLPNGLNDPESIGIIKTYMNAAGFKDSLESLISKGSLRYVDLAALKGVAKQEEKGLSAPVLLYSTVLPDGTPANLDPNNGKVSPVPLAIRLNCFQNASENPVFVPSDDNWFLAKLFYNNADVNYHEAISHLLQTHLTVEAVSLIAERQLDVSHPVYQLFFPHFFFTPIINELARHTLVAKGGIFDTSFSTGYDGVFELMSNYWKNFDIADLDFDVDSKNKNFNTKAESTIDPYRYFAGEHWSNILEYVGSFLKRYYTSQSIVDNDKELQNFFRLIFSEEKDGANFKKSETYSKITVDNLIRFVSSVIFDASVVHSAVNFNQAEYFGYTPAAPPKLAFKPPTDRNTPPDSANVRSWEIRNRSEINENQDKYLKQILPDESNARAGFQIVDILSTATDVPLGDFYESHFSMFDEESQHIVQSYLNKLHNCQWRFQANRMKYPYLLPSKIAMSISI